MTLDQTKLAQMLADASFYDMVPAMEPLRVAALRAAERWQAAMNDKECGRCGAHKNMHAIIESFRALLIKSDAETRQQIRKYLVERAGRNAEEFCISVRKDRMIMMIKL